MIDLSACILLELIESTMYLYQATKDPYFLEVGRDILHSIETSCRTECGYATVSCKLFSCEVQLVQTFLHRGSVW
jgi:hypothetical protein